MSDHGNLSIACEECGAGVGEVCRSLGRDKGHPIQGYHVSRYVPTVSDEELHPGYGPCDGFGVGGECSQCTGEIQCDDGSVVDLRGNVLRRPAGDALTAARDRLNEATETLVEAVQASPFATNDQRIAAWKDYGTAQDALIRVARAEGAADLHGLAYAADGHLLSVTELRFLQHAARSPSSGTEAK